MGKRSPKRGEVRVGTSGYQYDDWSGRFYPEDMPKSHWFEHYAKHFDTVEVNGTFYGLPEAETFERWKEEAPDGFCYALKFSRYGSHLKKLKDAEDTIGLFIERAKRLGPTLGPILVQLPPHWNVDVDRLAAFLQAAPKRYRWAIELRDRSWLCKDVYDLLRAHDAALCIHDMIEDHPRVTTAGWVYLRFHGDHYAGSYSHQALSGAARRIRSHLDEGRDVYVYFNNDIGGCAVQDAQDLRRYLGN